jgi:alpha/beta superfamily hydrolase
VRVFYVSVDINNVGNVMADRLLKLQGPAGILEAILTQPIETAATVAIICHPHPLYGGSLQNKVVHTLMRTFRELNITSVRFNFRGVGKSEGIYDHGVGETDDLLAVIKWVMDEFPHARIWLAGFSFGAFVVANAATKVIVKIEQLIMVAPPVGKFDFSNIAFINNSICVVMGDQDEVVEPHAVEKWVHQHRDVELLWLPGADHFFHEKLTLLKDKITAYLIKTYPALVST